MFLSLLLLFSQTALPQTGPRMSDEYLFKTALNLEFPGLEAVKAAVIANDYATARAAWATHVRTRTNPPKKSSVPAPYETDDFGPKRRANPRDYGGASGGWLRYVFDGAKADDTQYDRNRAFKCNHLKGAVTGYERNGDSRIPEAWVINSGLWMSMPIHMFPPYDQMADAPGGWKVAPKPVQDDTGSWQYLSAGQRIADGWWNAYTCFVNTPQFHDDAIVNFTKSVLEHGMFFHTDVDTGFGNWRACGLHGLFVVTCLFPECNWADEWRLFAIEKLEEYAESHLMPDGSNVEICSHYGNLALGHQQGFLFKAELCGYDHLISPRYMEMLKSAYDFNLSIMTPDRKDIEIGGGRTAEAPGYVPDYNATGSLLASFYILERGLELFPNDPSYQWVITDGAQGVEPPITSNYLPYFGIALMRSGWGRQESLLTLKSSPYGLMHGNYDVNSVSLWAFGRRIIWDSPISDGTPSTYHSTIVVDGLAQDNYKAGTGLPINVNWKSTDQYDYVSSVFDAYWGSIPNRRVEHYRRVIFVKPDIYIVIDDLVNNDGAPHSYESRWVLDSQNVSYKAATKASVTTDPNVPNLAIVPLEVAATSVKKYAKAADPYMANETKGSFQDLTIVSHDVSANADARLVTLLHPLLVGQSNPVASVTKDSPTVWTVHMNDGRTLTIDAEAGHDGDLAVTETGGANRSVSIAGASVDRPFYSYFENFEVYDSAESPKMTYRRVFDKVKHQVAVPAGLAGVEGKWAGEVTVKQSGSTNARSTPANRIPLGTPSLVVKGKVGYPAPLNGNVRFRMSITIKNKAGSNTKVDGPWISLDASKAGTFIDYESEMTLPDSANVIQFVQVDVDQQTSKPEQKVYVDAIRVLFPGELEETGDPNDDLIQAENFDATNGVIIGSGGTGKKIGSIEDGFWARYDDFDFGTGAGSLEIQLSSNTAGGNVELRLDSASGPLIGTASVGYTGGWYNFRTVSIDLDVTPEGIHDLFLVFTGGDGLLLEVDSFAFSAADVPPYTGDHVPGGNPSILMDDSTFSIVFERDLRVTDQIRTPEISFDLTRPWQSGDAFIKETLLGGDGDYRFYRATSLTPIDEVSSQFMRVKSVPDAP